MLDARHAAEIAERYSLGDGASLAGPVARGELGQVWRLATSHGVFAVKELFEPLSETEVREDADYQQAALDAGVPAPAILRTTDGTVLVRLDQAQVRAYGWVDLRERDPDLDPVEVGRVVAAIHCLRFSGQRPLDPWYTDPVGEDGWDELVGTLEAKGAPFAGRLAELRNELAALETWLEPPADLQTCHRDLWADNLRSTSAGGLCVIDWEECGLADPSQELALVLFEFGSGDARRARTLYEAYLDAGGPGRIDRRGNFSMAIAQIGHIGEISCRTWLDPRESELERNHSFERVAEFTSKPLTRAVIDELLDAVGER
jgi:Ser/Thr protein kinase RdoA (MazF antagonist)